MPNSNINMNIDVHLQNNMKETRTNVENGFNSFTQYRKLQRYNFFQEGTTRFVF